MIEKGKISSFQMFFILYPLVVATGDLVIPSFSAKLAKQDLWISSIFASIIGFIVLFTVIRLHNLYPGKTLIQYSEQIAGKIVGKVISICFLFYILDDTSSIMRQYSQFVHDVFLPNTPIYIIISAMVIVCSFAVSGGVEAIARSAQFFIPFVILAWGVILILLIPDMNPRNMFPILEKGLLPPLKGGVPTGAWFSHFVLIAFLLPYLTDPVKAKKWGVISLLAIMMNLVLITLSTLFVFGVLTGDMIYPVMTVVRYIRIGDFLEHLESIMMAIWVVGCFIKISIYYYVFTIGFSQMMRLSSYQPIVRSCGFLIVVFTVWISKMDIHQYFSSLGTTFPFVVLLFGAVLPVGLLIVAWIRTRRKNVVKTI
ncbi:spore germination protein [Paenibacillus polysaccharolyticus]|uniref:GerAB/ArcD/ProY family transporter n=1 Tax=Paenibacillus polysaccharolyticus TaxID=582692 RepID=UPI00209C701F|nr:endospore germination permease [Paenibacillus polysaccharolyticus]MCP1136245.1 spore germination protein [Paenibacillus polysaccharolyticus]